MRPPTAPRRPAASTRAAAPVSRDASSDSDRSRGADLVISDFEDDDLEFDDDGDTSIVVGPDRDAAPVRSLEPALAAREKARRRVLLVRLAIGAGVLAVLVGLGWVALYSPVTALDSQEISVSGGGPWVDQAAVLALASTQEGTALLRVDTGAIQEQLQALPGVAQANVQRAFPRGLTLEITPREGVALVRLDDASVQLVGGDGVVITTMEEAAAPGELPVLTVDMAMPDAGTAVNEALTVLATMPTELRAQVAEAGATGPRTVTLVLTDGAEVVWGSAQEAELKAAVLATLLPVGADHYDVSEPKTPITT